MSDLSKSLPATHEYLKEINALRRGVLVNQNMDVCSECGLIVQLMDPEQARILSGGRMFFGNYVSRCIPRGEPSVFLDKDSPLNSYPQTCRGSNNCLARQLLG